MAMLVITRGYIQIRMATPLPNATMAGSKDPPQMLHLSGLDCPVEPCFFCGWCFQIPTCFTLFHTIDGKMYRKPTYIYIHTLKNMVSGEDCSLNIHWECSNPSPQSHLSAECCSTGSGGKPPRRNRQRVHTYSICTHTHTIADTNVYICILYLINI